MINYDRSVMGIIFPNSYDALVPELVSERSMASIPFAARYRMVDFVLSSMVNSGIDNISILVRRNYHSLMDHLGSGREWDLTRKNGGLTIFPPYAEKNVKRYTGRVEALGSILGFLKDQKEKYVVMADSNIAANFDFAKMLDEHIASGADVSVAYNVQELPSGLKVVADSDNSLYYTLTLDENKRVNYIYINPNTDGPQNLSMNIYMVERKLLIEQITEAFMRGQVYYERDVLTHNLDRINVHGFKFDGYCSRISDIKAYFDENMKLLNEENLDGLFESAPIYTKIRDDNPSRYKEGSVVKNVLSADGCIIEGEVENCVLFRGVHIEKGAKVKNCILMQDTVVKAGSTIEYLITDKNVTITENKEMRGTDSFPVFIAKKQIV